MRALIISIIILLSILTFSVANTIYINMKLCDLTRLAEQIDELSLKNTLDDFNAIWNKLSGFLRITIADSKIDPVESTLGHLEQIALGAKSDLMTAQSDLLSALGKISELEEFNLLHIF